MKKIIVLFKTHLDVGFTGLAEEIVEKYNQIYIPQALQVSEELSKENVKEGFVWTTGSWLIWQYLEQAGDEDRMRMERTIRNGNIAWHGLPATLHSELADSDLLRYGLSLSKELDERYGVHTTGAKYTDVPGHTIGIVPLLEEAGIQLLHIGVNGASSPPDVPDLFRWQAGGGEEVVVMYSKGGYGEFSIIPNTNIAVHFAHTFDNMGPQSAAEVKEIYAKLHEEYPEAEICAGSLNDVAEAVMQIADTLPVVTSEIGDSWIHGVGADPQKIGQYRSLLHLAETLKEEEKKALYRELLFIPEHTWGLDEKTFLHDHQHYARDEFEKVRGADNYLLMERSWQEQRAYITKAVQRLDGEAKREAEEVIKICSVDYPSFAGAQKIENQAEKKGWIFTFDERGAICGLEKGGVRYADAQHKLCDFRYEVFSEQEVKGFMDRYLTIAFDWAMEDFGKVGLADDIEKYQAFSLCCDGIYETGDTFLLALSPELTEAYEAYGCPPKLILKITPLDEKVIFDFAWFNKPALRIPEALWLGFCPVKPLTAIRKFDTEIDPQDVVSKGNREMHCCDGDLRFEDITVTTVDAPLIAVGRPSGYGFHNQIPDTTKGVWVNLFNNLWGTNFPMWNEGDARFRFELKI